MSDPILLTSEQGHVGIVTLNMAHKRNALNEEAIAAIDEYFSTVPSHIRVILLTAEGEHFCAGLDLKEHHDKVRSGVEFMRVCQGWHRAFDKIQHGGIPVVACLQGAVVGGGLELASAAHVRVADGGTFFALPEGTRGIFTGGGATVRTARIISAPRMVEMMLTGRVVDAHEGLRLGLAHYVCDPAKGDTPAPEFALNLAKKIAGNAALSNYAIVSAINRIADMSATDGLFTEGLVMAMIQQGHDVQERLGEFVNKKAPKVRLEL
ncbi:MAG: crotonase/enoyl-CoA hydratase family protein [Burkholderiaceae bacterium]